MQLHEVTDQAQWDTLVQNSTFGHPLQLWAWGEIKQLNGWEVLRLATEDGRIAAQMLLWCIPRTRYKLAYIPRGPLVDPHSSELHPLLTQLGEIAKQHGAIQLKVEPAWQHVKLPKAWKRSNDNVLLAQTYTIDLTQSEEELQANFASKGRQYIRKTERDGVQVRRVTDAAEVHTVLQVYAETAARANFALHSKEYYLDLFVRGGNENYLYVAEAGGAIIAFVWLLASSGTAFELYGGMSAEGARLRANYALKAHAILAMKQEGATLYDFNGRLNDGVSYFKSLWGADETDWIGSFNLPLHPLRYSMWQVAWPVGKTLNSLRGRL